MGRILRVQGAGHWCNYGRARQSGRVHHPSGTDPSGRAARRTAGVSDAVSGSASGRGSPSGCVPPDIGPAPILRLEDYLRSPTACEQVRVNVCTVLLVGPAGSHALVCRDARGTITRTVRLVAPDGSVVAEGACVADGPIGAWLTWSGDQLESARSYVEPGVLRGLQLHRRDHVYQDGFFPPPATPRIALMATSYCARS